MNLYRRLKTARGFTLIELLVVIAIIGILASLIIVSLTNSQAKAGDADRKTRAKSLGRAAEQYKVDTATYPCNHMPPNSLNCDPDNGTGNNGGINTQNPAGDACASVLQSALVSSGSAKKYLENGDACVEEDDANITHRYKAISSGAAYYYVIAWEMKNQSEKAFAAPSQGNGIYKTNSSGVINGSANGMITISAIQADKNYFVVYGPQ